MMAVPSAMARAQCEALPPLFISSWFSHILHRPTQAVLDDTALCPGAQAEIAQRLDKVQKGIQGLRSTIFRPHLREAAQPRMQSRDIEAEKIARRGSDGGGWAGRAARRCVSPVSMPSQAMGIIARF